MSKGEKKVILKIDRKEAQVNGIKYTLDAPASIIQGRTFLPVRFVAEAFDASVDWNSGTRRVTVIQNDTTGKLDIVVTGYYFDWRSLESLQSNINKITDTIHFSYEIDSQGRVEETNYFDQGYQLARQNGMGVEMLVFGNNRAQLITLLNDANAQKVLIDDILRFLKERDFDGVNLDLENIDKTLRTQYLAFVKNLKNKLGSSYTLSLSLPSRSSDRETWRDGYDYAGLAKVADRVMIMAYDQHYAGGTPGPVAGNDWVEQVIKYLLPLIPKEKFELGLGIYGYDWPETGAGKSLYVQAARDLAATEKAVIQKDAVSGVSFFSYSDDAGVTHQVWYEERDSVKAKMELVKKYRLAGVALWRLGIIPQDIWEIINKD